MTWKDIIKQDGLQKAPFGMFRRNKTPAEPKPTLNQKFLIDDVKRNMGEIVNEFKNDPNFEGMFAIKPAVESASGRGRKRGLVWDMPTFFGDVNFVQQHGIPVLEQHGFTAEKMGDMIQVRKK